MKTIKTQRVSLGELAKVFLQIGVTAFGGPATSMAMMRQEAVLKRDWLTEDEFLDFMGISNLVPGPNAAEMAAHIGYRCAGLAGLLVAGGSIVLPSMVIVMGLAWAYVSFGSLPELTGVLYGIKPVVVAILAWALFGMLKPRWRNMAGMGIALGVLTAYLFGVSPLILLLAGGGVMWLYQQIASHKLPPAAALAGLPVILRRVILQRPLVPFNLWRLFWVFLKAGALMYGSGYVLLAFIQDDLVNRLGWLTQSQLVDAIAVGQVTPGPLATTATFVGYVTGGVPAALLATLAMFLPGFLFVLITHPLLKKVQQSAQWRHVLDGVIFAALGLMAGVSFEVAQAALVDPVTIGVALVALVLLGRFKLRAHWLILGGAAVGLAAILL
jgi:chromate transporter